MHLLGRDGLVRAVCVSAVFPARRCKGRVEAYLSLLRFAVGMRRFSAAFKRLAFRPVRYARSGCIRDRRGMCALQGISVPVVFVFFCGAHPVASRSLLHSRRYTRLFACVPGVRLVRQVSEARRRHRGRPGVMLYILRGVSYRPVRGCRFIRLILRIHGFFCMRTL